MKLDTVLGIALEALMQDVAPAVGHGRPRATLRSVMRILAHLQLNCAPQDEASRDAAGRVLAMLRELGFDAEAGKESQVAVDVDAPERYFGGAQCHAELQSLLEQRLLPALPDAKATQAISALLAWEQAALDRVQGTVEQLLLPLGDHRVVAAPIEQAPASSDRAQGERLEACLRTRYPGSPDLRVTRFEPFAAGRSKVTAAVDLEACAELPRELVFRQDVLQNVTGGFSVVQEFGILNGLYRYGVKVPQAFLVEAAAEPMAGAFLLMSRVQGICAAEGMHLPPSAAVVREAARQLAKLHRVPTREFDGLLQQAAAPTRESLLAEIDEFERTWASYPPRVSLAARQGIDWLRRHIDLAMLGDQVLTHRDLMFHNVLADGDELTALLDWEFARIGYPAEDLGYTRPVAERVIPWSEFLALYEEAGGPVLDRRQIDFYSVWSALRLGAMMAYVNALQQKGEVRNVEHMCMSFHETNMLLQRLTTLMVAVTEAFPTTVANDGLASRAT